MLNQAAIYQSKSEVLKKFLHLKAIKIIFSVVEIVSTVQNLKKKNEGNKTSDEDKDALEFFKTC